MMARKSRRTTSDVSIADKNIEAINQLEKQAALKRTRSERFAQRVTDFAGSMLFIVVHVVWFVVWISFNTGVVPGIPPWDPFPFSFLTLVVSLEAIFLSLLVLMTQNRLTEDADKRALLDLHINMLAEEESTATLQMLEKICEHLGIVHEADEAQQLAEATDVINIATKLEKQTTDDR